MTKTGFFEESERVPKEEKLGSMEINSVFQFANAIIAYFTFWVGRA